MKRLIARSTIGLIRYTAFIVLCGIAAAQQSPPSRPSSNGDATSTFTQLNFPLVNEVLRSKARSTSGGRCAENVAAALQAGGVKLSEATKALHAKDYGPYLESSGFSKIPAESYRPQPGDIVIFQPYRGGPPSGHIAMYVGDGWISDFKQKDVYGGSGYRKSGASHAFYRHGNVVTSKSPVAGTAAGTRPRDAAPVDKPAGGGKTASSPPAEQPKPKDEQTERLERRAKELAEKGWKPREKTPGEKLGEARIVIPEDCIIEVVTWSDKNPERATATYHVRGGRTTASVPDFVSPPEKNGNCTRTGFRWSFQFTGTAQDNSIDGEWLNRATPFEDRCVNDQGQVDVHVRKSQEDKRATHIILNADGTATWNVSSVYTWKYEIFVGGPYTDGSRSDTDAGVGVWQFRKRDAASQENSP